MVASETLRLRPAPLPATGFEGTATATPAGAPERVSVTGPEKPPVRVMVTSTDALSPWARAREGIAVDKTTDGAGDGAAVVSEHAETVAQARRSAAT
jgi:hypothetical protein